MMKSRFTILSTVVAFLLMLGLATTPGFAQLILDVEKTQTMVVDTGHNQRMGELAFTAGGAAGEADLEGVEGAANVTITISYGGLKIA